MVRNIKSKVRATDTEFLKLHEIAGDNKLKLAQLLRESTLNRDFSRLVLKSEDDLYALVKVTGQLEMVISEAINAIDTLMPSMSDKGVEMSAMMDNIKVSGDSIISKLKKRREKVAEKVIALMEENADSAIYDYMDNYEHKNNDIVVPCTVEEIKTVRRKADEAGVTISCLLKTNAFEYYKYGTVVVMSGDVFPLVKELNAKTASMRKIMKTMQERKPMKNDVRELRDIVNEMKSLVANKRKGINLNVADINREAKSILKKAACI